MTDLVKQPEVGTGMALPEQRPAFISADDNTGKQGITRDDVKLPRLIIAQGLHPQLIEGDSTYIPNLRMFDLFNELTSEIYGKGPLKFVPIRRDVVRLEFDPNDAKKVLDRNVPPNDARLEWDGDNPPRATKFTEFTSLLFHDDQPGRKPELVVISVKETNKFMRRAAERLTGFIMFQDGPIYGGFKTVASKPEKNDKGTFGVYVFNNSGFIQDEKVFRWVEKFAKTLEGKTISVNREPGDESGILDGEEVAKTEM